MIIGVLSILIFQSAAFAVQTEGEVIFRDALYGAEIGAILGGAIYLAEQDDIGEKLGAGVAVGTIDGLVFGITEIRTLVETEKDKIKVAFPIPVIEKKRDDLRYSASLLKTRF